MCGHVGCRHQSPGRHAAKHYHATRHPIIEGYALQRPSACRAFGSSC
jgi:hypothetical protein